MPRAAFKESRQRERTTMAPQAKGQSILHLDYEILQRRFFGSIKARCYNAQACTCHLIGNELGCASVTKPQEMWPKVCGYHVRKSLHSPDNTKLIWSRDPNVKNERNYFAVSFMTHFILDLPPFPLPGSAGDLGLKKRGQAIKGDNIGNVLDTIPLGLEQTN